MNEVVNDVLLNEVPNDNSCKAFFFEEFKAFVEYCDTNFVKVKLFAISGEVKGCPKEVVPSPNSPIQVKIPFGRLGNLVKAFQKYQKCRVINVVYNENHDEYVYLITSPRFLATSPKLK